MKIFTKMGYNINSGKINYIFIQLKYLIKAFTPKSHFSHFSRHHVLPLN
jgi:hypothetical protein